MIRKGKTRLFKTLARLTVYCLFPYWGQGTEGERKTGRQAKCHQAGEVLNDRNHLDFESELDLSSTSLPVAFGRSLQFSELPSPRL